MGKNGFFPLLVADHENEGLMVVPEQTWDIEAKINEYEMDLKMDEVRTVISTIVNLRCPNHS